MDITEVRRRQDDQTFVRKMNEHVNGCQVCQQGTLCEIAERIIDDEEAQLAQQRQANLARKLKQAGL